METRIISLSLTEEIKKSLSRMSFGLPYVDWYNANDFNLMLCQLEIPNSSYDLDIIDLLKSHLPSDLLFTINGAKIHTSKNKGFIQIILKERNALEKLKHFYEKILNPLPITIKNSPETLTITLGTIQKTQPEKQSVWMETYSIFSQQQFAPEYLLYLKPQITAKNKFFISLEKMPISSSRNFV